MANLDLNTLHLAQGAHNERADGVCLLEAVAWYADEPHTSTLACVSPVLRVFGARISDDLDDGRRQGLRPLIPGLIGTAGDGLDEARSYMALDHLIRAHAPAWLDLAGLTAEGTTLRGLHRIVDPETAQAAGSAIRAAREKARAARIAAQEAKEIGAEDVTRRSGGGAARLAAMAGGLTARWPFAHDAEDAAEDAGWIAAAARRAVRPTVESLQDSAIALYAAMTLLSC